MIVVESQISVAPEHKEQEEQRQAQTSCTNSYAIGPRTGSDVKASEDAVNSDYGGVGIVAILEGGNFLDYDVLSHEPVHGQHLGILLVELGVGITVASVMATIFFLFAGRGRSDV